MTTCKGCKGRIRGEALVRVANVDAARPFNAYYHPACFPIPDGWERSPTTPSGGLDGHRESGEPDVLGRRRY